MTRPLILKPLSRTAADAERFARVVHADHLVDVNKMITPALTMLRAAVEREVGR